MLVVISVQELFGRHLFYLVSGSVLRSEKKQWKRGFGEHSVSCYIFIDKTRKPTVYLLTKELLTVPAF